MWRPPQRIKWHPDPGRWPSAEEAERSLLFGPVRVGRMPMASRTWVPARVPWRATEDGHVTEANIEWYERFARGRPGVIVVEATGIRDVPSGPLLRVGDDRFVPGLARLVDAVRRASGGETRLFIQLIDFLAIRRRPEPEKFFRQYLRITDRHRAALDARAWSENAVREHLAKLPEAERIEVLDRRELKALRVGYRERITDTDLAHIRDLPRTLPGLFAAAARRARTAGFDGVELHYAHAYTMASFLSARNDSSDGYGGARGNRVRPPLKVLRRVREVVGSDYTVGCRYLAEDCIQDGMGIEDAAWFGVEFARAGMDFLSLSRGGKFEDAKQPAVGGSAYPYTGPSGYECMPQYISDERGPFGRNVESATRIRMAVRAAGFSTPVVVSGGIHGFEQAETLRRDGKADLVGFARQSLADPDWFRKVKQGRGAEVRVCKYTNYCEALDQEHAQVTCELWDREALDEPGINKSRDGKRRMLPPLWSGPATTLPSDK